MVTNTQAAKAADQVAERFSIALGSSGHTWAWLAAETGIARTTLVRKSTTGAFTLPELSLIAQALGVQLSSLMPDMATEQAA